MQPISNLYYHGTRGDAILEIIKSGTLMPGRNGIIYLSRYSWQSCFMHGGDRKRRASFVIQVRIGSIDGHAMFRESPGILDTVEIQTDKPIPVEVCEMYVRLLTDGEAAVRRVSPVETIKKYLGPRSIAEGSKSHKES